MCINNHIYVEYVLYVVIIIILLAFYYQVSVCHHISYEYIIITLVEQSFSLSQVDWKRIYMLEISPPLLNKFVKI